jgi:putative restriction endonuclease
MQLKQPQDIFSLSIGDTVTKRNLFDLIQYSKDKGSSYWAGEDFSIGNTPQQGINWLGQLPAVKAVIIKTRLGSYVEDGWADRGKTTYHYSFKARNSKVSYIEKANQVLLMQPQYLYPIYLFSENIEGWRFEGTFFVSGIQDNYVVLRRGLISSSTINPSPDEVQYLEGARRYITHLMVERSRNIILEIKKISSWICEICTTDFSNRYGVRYIEAHHKIPISNYSEEYKITSQDLALLCPNCHRAVHIYMKNKGLEYNEIKDILSRE